MKHVKLALDWTPNINHIGFLIAKTLGFYERRGIDLEIINPLEDDYQTTPAKKLENDEADFAICPFESIVSLNNKTNKVNAIAVYAILQEDLSSIASLKSANITEPKQLDGKVYASYQARYEDEIVKCMIKNDQGEGSIQIIYPEKLGIWNTLLTGKADSTWIFDNWEGIEAMHNQIALSTFKMKDYEIPYGYSPVVICKKERLINNHDLYKDFIEESRNGFLFVKDNLSQSEEILRKYITERDNKHIDIKQSIAFTYPYFGEPANCGKMQEDRVVAFLRWIVNNKLESENILNQELYTNDLLV
jgi:ABC-type nitrate/sulfonate/bicarbonate transport system substrate-binding protein